MGGMMGGQSTKPYGYGSSMGSGGGIMAALTAKQQKKYGKQASKHGMGIEQFLQKKHGNKAAMAGMTIAAYLGMKKAKKMGKGHKKHKKGKGYYKGGGGSSSGSSSSSSSGSDSD